MPRASVHVVQTLVVSARGAGTSRSTVITSVDGRTTTTTTVDGRTTTTRS